MKRNDDNGVRKSLDLKGLVFTEKGHKYTYNGKQFISPSTILKDCFPFNGPVVAQYLKDIGIPSYQKSISEILKEWSQGAIRGTKTHKFVEDYLNGEFVSIESDHERVAFNYIQKQNFEDVICEVVIAHPGWGISGTVDALVRKNGKWYIYDWKTDSKIRTEGFKRYKLDGSKELKKEPPIDNGKAKGVLFEFENCNLNKFAFQLGIYKLILETFYDIPIHGMVVVHFSDSKATEYVLPFHKEYIGLLINQARKKQQND